MTPEQEKRSDDKLAILLQEYGEHVAQESQMDDTSRSQLVEDILVAANAPALLSAKKMSATRLTKRIVATALAVSLCLFIGFLFMGTQKTPHQIVTPQVLKEGYFRLNIEEWMAVVQGYESTLEQPLAWYAEDMHDVQFELLPQQSRITETHPLFVELSIWTRGRCKMYYLMTRGTQMLELINDKQTSPQLSFWIYPVDENLFAFEVAINENNGLVFSETIVGLIEPEKPLQTRAVKNGDVEYSVYLNVHPTT